MEHLSPIEKPKESFPPELAWVHSEHLCTSHDLEQLFDDASYTPEKLMALLKKSFPDVYEKSVGVSEGYTLEEHTLMGSRCLEAYFSDDQFTEMFTKNDFRFMYGVHDLGKPTAVENGNKDLQHVYTVQALEYALPKIGIAPDKIKIITSLIQSDPIGLYLQGFINLEKSITLIEEATTNSTLDKETFIRLLFMYYKTDGLSYTVHAGGTEKSPLNRVLGLQSDGETSSIEFIGTSFQKIEKLLAALHS